MNIQFYRITSSFSIKGLLAATALGVLGFAGTAQAIITFTVDTFTTDELTITFTPGSELSGSAPSLLPDRLLIYGMFEDSQASGWYLELVDGTGPVDLTLGTAIMSTAPGNLAVLGGKVLLNGSTNFAEGDAIGGTSTTVTWSKVGSFDPTKVDTLVLSWGINGSYDTPGTIQSTVAVPEPGIAAALAGVLVLGFALWYRRNSPSC